MNYDKVEQLVTAFIRTMRTFAIEPNTARGTCVVLIKTEDGGWSLEAKKQPVEKRDYVCVVEIPDDIFDEPTETFYARLSTHLAIRLAKAVPAINANLGRTPEQKTAAARKAVAARWAKK